MKSKKYTRSILSFLLTFALIFQQMGVTTFAEEVIDSTVEGEWIEQSTELTEDEFEPMIVIESQEEIDRSALDGMSVPDELSETETETDIYPAEVKISDSQNEPEETKEAEADIEAESVSDETTETDITETLSENEIEQTDLRIHNETEEFVSEKAEDIEETENILDTENIQETENILETEFTELLDEDEKSTEEELAAFQDFGEYDGFPTSCPEGYSYYTIAYAEGLYVEAYAPDAAFSMSVTLEAKLLSENSKVYKDAIDSLESSGEISENSSYTALDIHFANADGMEMEPDKEAGQIYVRFFAENIFKKISGGGYLCSREKRK